MEEDHLWKIRGDGGGGCGGWTIKGRRDSFGMSLWKDIRKGWEEFSVETLI